MKSKAQVMEWLDTTNPARVILVEISGVYSNTGTVLPTFYLSNRAYGSSSLAAAYQATSNTSNTVSLGLKTFVIQENKSFIPGEQVLLTSGTNQLVGLVSSYSGTSLTVEVTEVISGAGTQSVWTIKLDVPENKLYDAVIVGGVTFTESIDLNGQPNIGYGDIELENVTGSRDTWLEYVWANKPITVWIGDISWPRSDFYPIFRGLVKDIDIKSRTSLNLILVNKLQVINEAVSTATLTGTSTTADQLVPLCFGECFNVTPAIKTATSLVYQVHNGPIETVVEVRDNGAPVAFSQNTTAGTFQLQYNPFGTITATVQGAKPNAVYASKLGSVIKTLLRNYGKQLTASEVDEAGMDLIDDTTNLEVGVYLTNRENVLEVCQRIAYSAGYYLVPDISGKLKLIRLVTDGFGTLPSILSKGSEFDNAQWTKTGVVVAGASINNIAGPDGTQTADKLIENTATGMHYLYNAVTTKLNQSYSYTAYYKYINRRYIRHSFVSSGSINGIYADVDLSLGTIVNSGQLGTGTLNSVNIISLVNGWYKVTITGTIGGTSTTNYCAITFRNGPENVLTEQDQIYTGIGYSIYAWGAELVPIYTLNQKDMEFRSLSISQKVEVQGTVKLGYSKNWTPQSSGLVYVLKPEALAVLEKPYYYETVTDAQVVNQYKQIAEPVAKDTLLISQQDAQIEANRLLNMNKTPRFIYTANYFAKMLFCELGDLIYLTHPRFGLTPGKTGIAVSISRDWLQGKVTIGTFI